jgi:hypothetical protein
MSGSKVLAQRLKAVTVADFLTFTGGTTPESGPCEPFSPHGYFGIEPKVTQAIIKWMRDHETHG